MEYQLHPWMLRQDWRDFDPPFCTVDLSTWPADEPLNPLPPVPVLAAGPVPHPQAPHADILIEPPISLDTLAAAIARAPRAAATVAQLLRATEYLRPAEALVAESFAFAMLQGSSEHAAWRAAQPVRPILPPGTLHMARHGSEMRVLLDRPWAQNAIDRAMRDALFEAFALPVLDPSITQVKFRSTGKCFCQGADLAEFGTTTDPAAAHLIRARTLPAHEMARRPEIYDVHVQGGCIGSGLEMAAFAGRLTADQKAWFQLPETQMGILPGFGGCVSIPRRIGRQRAAALMLSGKRIFAPQALEWGLIDAIKDEPPADERFLHEGGG